MSVLRDAYELIKDEEHWTKGAIARDSQGWPVRADEESATQWCGAGALLRSGFTRESSALIKTLDNLSQEVFDSEWLTTVNDNRGREAVLQLFEKVLTDEEGGIPL